MAELALIAQWTLAVVLVVSGVAKLVDRPATADAMVDLGVPEGLRWAAPLVPATELVLAFLLAVAATARWAAVGSLALLAVFSAAVGINLARGRRPDCNCFGRLTPGPIGVRTLVRNGALMILAVLAAATEAVPPRDLLARVPTSAIVAGSVVLGFAVMVGVLVLGLGPRRGSDRPRGSDRRA